MSKVFCFYVQVYGDRLIARNGPIPWPARSPDMNPLDYGGWGTGKESVYHNGAPDTVEELRGRVEDCYDEFNNDPVLIQNTTQQIRRRAQLCIECEGGHFEQALRRRRGEGNFLIVNLQVPEKFPFRMFCFKSPPLPKTSSLKNLGVTVAQ